MLVYENNLYWREDVLEAAEDDLALSNGDHHQDWIVYNIRIYVYYTHCRMIAWIYGKYICESFCTCQ